MKLCAKKQFRGGEEKMFYEEYLSRKLKEKKDKEYKWPIIHKQNKHGNGILWSNKKDKKHFTPKVVLNFNVKLYPYLD